MDKKLACDVSSHSGVATGWTGVDMSTPVLLKVAPEIDTNPTSFFTGGGYRGSLRLQTPVIGSRTPRTPCLPTPHILSWRRPWVLWLGTAPLRGVVPWPGRDVMLLYRYTFIIGIPSPTHSFTLGLNPSFSANPPYRSLSFVSFKIHYMDFPDCLLLLLSISVFLLFGFFLFLHFFSCRFRAVD